MQSRTHAREASASEARVNLTVDVAVDAGNARGQLGIALADGQQSLREIPADTCHEVVRTMAVIAALVLEGRGLDEPLPESAATVVPATRANTSGRRETPSERRRLDRNTLPIPQSGATSGGSSVHLRAVFRGSVESAVSKAWSPGVAAGAELRLERSGWFAPDVRLLGRLVAGGRERTRLGDAKFRLVSGSVVPCPTRLRPAAGWELRPCALFEAGDLHGRGENTLGRRSSHMPWLGAGAALRTEHRITPWFAFDLEARALALFHHDRFVFEPGLVAHDVPPLAFALSAGLLVGPP